MPPCGRALCTRVTESLVRHPGKGRVAHNDDTRPTHQSDRGDVGARDRDTLEHEVRALGHTLAETGHDRRTGLFHLGWWSERMLEWAMAEPTFKTQLFRFVDVFPACRLTTSCPDTSCAAVCSPRSGRTIRLSPPLVIKELDIDWALEQLRRSLDDLLLPRG